VAIYLHFLRRWGILILTPALDLVGVFPCPNPFPSFSIGQSGVESLKKYIANQKAHHRRTTFQEEFRAFLTKYQIEHDERYVWD
jgi:putative transposase